MAKCKLEIEDVEGVNEPIPTASVHGLIQTLSPVKKRKQSEYYECKLLLNELTRYTAI